MDKSAWVEELSSKVFKLDRKGTKEKGFLVHLDKLSIEVNRIYYRHNAHENSKKGAHAYKNTEKVIICVSGSIKVSCFDGVMETIYELNNPHEALYISPKTWRTAFNHSQDAVILVLSSLEYDEYMAEIKYSEHYIYLPMVLVIRLDF